MVGYPPARMAAMRISDDRYHRERLQMELALRFLRHEARTQTIRAWTGLSDDRIRKLYHSYLDHARGAMPRHRGKSPHQVAFFTRSLRQQEDTLALATCLWLLGVLGTRARRSAPGSLPGLARGTTAVPGLRGLPAGAPRRADLLRARGVPDPARCAWRATAHRLVRRLRRAHGDRAVQPAGRSRCHHCTGTAHSRC